MAGDLDDHVLYRKKKKKRLDNSMLVSKSSKVLHYYDHHPDWWKSIVFLFHVKANLSVVRGALRGSEGLRLASFPLWLWVAFFTKQLRFSPRVTRFGVCKAKVCYQWRRFSFQHRILTLHRKYSQQPTSARYSSCPGVSCPDVGPLRHGPISCWYCTSTTARLHRHPATGNT